MNIKKSILELINCDQYGRNLYRALEKLIFIVLEDYLKNQGKEIITENQYLAFDAMLPDGIDDISGETAVDIKVYKNNVLVNTIYDAIGRASMTGKNIDTLLFIIVNEVSEHLKNRICEKKNTLNFNIRIFDIDDIVNICNKNEELFIKTYKNINEVLLNDTIKSGLNINNNIYIERNMYINQLNTEYNNDNIVLFLGAGVSFDAKIPTWDEIISKLFVSFIDNKLKDNNIEMHKEDRKKIVGEIMKQNSNSPLLQTRFLKSGFKEKFEDILSDILYENAVYKSELLEEIGQLCISKRGKVGVKAIITLNFDDLIEKNLERLRVKHSPVYSEGMSPDNESIGIYHVHGFMPKEKENYKNLTKSLLVFSEEGYHKLFLEPYNWANLTQLNFLIHNTCIFIGLSLTDPNLRRLLEIATSKRVDNDEKPKHYAIMHRFKIECGADFDNIESIKKFEGINEKLQENFFEELGVNIIWVDDFSDIPSLLKQIKENA